MPLDNSPTTEGFEAAWIEEGTITRVDPDTHKVDWSGENSDRECDEIALASPYTHQAFGEGFSHLPDVGAKAVVCHTSDDAPPLVLAYYTDPEEKKNDKGETEHSHRSDRQKMLPGEMRLQGRAGHLLYLRRGGILQLGANPACQTFYFPVSNLLWDVCKRYKLDAGGGQLVWEVKEVGGVKDAAEFRVVLRDKASDLKATTALRIGKLMDATPIPATTPAQVVAEFQVAPALIDDKGRSPIQKYVLRIDKNGNVFNLTNGMLITNCNDEVFQTMKARRTVVLTNDTLTITGNRTEFIVGMRDSTALRQVVRALTEVLLEAPINRYGSIAATQPGVLGLPLVQALVNHSHPGPNRPSTDLGGLPATLTKKHFWDG